QRPRLGSCCWFFLQRLRGYAAVWGAGLCRPSVFRDENRELTWMYLQRVGTALHPSKPCSIFKHTSNGAKVAGQNSCLSEQPPTELQTTPAPDTPPAA